MEQRQQIVHDERDLEPHRPVARERLPAARHDVGCPIEAEEHVAAPDVDRRLIGKASASPSQPHVKARA